MREPADSGDPVIFVMNALAAEVPIHSQSASDMAKVSLVGLARGITLVKVEKLASFLSRYPEHAGGRLLFLGFSEGFLIPCALASIPPVPANLQSERLHSSVVSAKLPKEVAIRVWWAAQA